ncbi:unnamed protein product [Ectocarpus sp. CCAP 1310/34]|nr:unnamed protein product [Ectocarpus sp. CCAP 1310/34]
MPPKMLAVIRRFDEGMRARVRTDDGLRQGCNLAPLLFNLFFAAMLMVAVAEFDKDPKVTTDMVKIGIKVEYTGKKGTSGGKKTTVVTDVETLLAMLYTDDAAIVSRSPESLDNMMSVMVRVAGLFGLMVSEPKTEIMCILPKGIEERPLMISAAGQTYKQTDQFVYLGHTIFADGKADREITSRSCRAWKCYRRNAGTVLRCTTWRRADLQLKIRLLQAEVVETLLYECSSWSLTVEHCTNSMRPTASSFHGASTGAIGNAQTAPCRERLCVSLGGDLVAFNMGDEKEGGKWKESAKDSEVWYNKVEDGAAWLMRKWHRQEAEAFAKRQRAREAEAESTAISGPKRKRAGEAAVRGKER